MTTRAIGLCILVLAMSGGCKKEPPAQTIVADEYLGTWTETRDSSDPGFTSRSVPPDIGMRELRQLVMNADNSFKMSLVDPRSKKPTSATESIDGTWAVGKYGIEFTVSTNTLKGDAGSWTPAGARRVEMASDSGPVPRLNMYFDADLPSAIMIHE
ncbi:MAG: hypothetical protein KDA32_05930 [Phycisphaerales bacterium]|nr:hypothetical protein [Phycisphaerales bacterium]